MIIIRGLNKAFGEKIIFSNFNLEIPDGSFVVISGDSGSGKSTLLNMIGGIEKPDMTACRKSSLRSPEPSTRQSMKRN